MRALSYSNKGGSSALFLCASNGHSTGLHLLVSAGADVDQPCTDGWTALMKAAQNGDEAAALTLLHAGASRWLTNDEGETASTIALKHGHNSMVSLLSDPSAARKGTISFTPAQAVENRRASPVKKGTGGKGKGGKASEKDVTKNGRA
mmetsp:Transcript_64770/g.193540  ORF Transcript_64770/g.193540 Transcript_64770/m.193540 type:complete len:148 (-) Transcript_64770:128-571(-)